MQIKDDYFYQTQFYTGNRNICPVVFTDEHFEPHPKYHRYLVSTYGRVYDTKKECMKIPVKRTYLTYDITISPCHRTSIGAHRMVLQTFKPIENETGMVPNHKDLNKMNNKLENLEWVSYQENCIHAIENGAYDPKGENNSTSTHSNFEVQCICQLLEKNISFKEICKEMNYPYNMANICFLSSIKHKKTWVHISKNYNF